MSTLDPHEAFIVAMVEEQKDVTLDEVVTRLDAQVDLSIYRSVLMSGSPPRLYVQKHRTRIGAGAG